jgi:surfeit locus 1 family protein
VKRIVWSKRLVKLLAFALLIATACVALGIWQIARLHQTEQFNAAVRSGLSAAPRPLPMLLSDGVDPDTVRYRRAEVTGTYDVAREFVLYGRTQNDQAGNHMLTPLVLADGSAVLVDRGWVPLDEDRPGATASAPPLGVVNVVGVLFSSEGDPPSSIGNAPTGETTLSKIDLTRIQSRLPYRIAPLYLLLQRQTPGQPGVLPMLSPLPELSNGPHLGYAIQWFTFATIALIGFVVLALREGEDHPSGVDGAPPDDI